MRWHIDIANWNLYFHRITYGQPCQHVRPNSIWSTIAIMVKVAYTAGISPRAAHTRRYPTVPNDTDWLTQQEIATMTGKDIREVREAVRNLRRAGVIQTTVSPEDERLILVHKDSLPVVKSALRATA
jgi:hypothetical protein